MDENVKVWSPPRQTRHEIQERKTDVKRSKRSAARYNDIIRNAAIMVAVAILSSVVTGISTTAKLKREFETELVQERFRV